MGNFVEHMADNAVRKAVGKAGDRAGSRARDRAGGEAGGRAELRRARGGGCKHRAAPTRDGAARSWGKEAAIPPRKAKRGLPGLPRERGYGFLHLAHGGLEADEDGTRNEGVTDIQFAEVGHAAEFGEVGDPDAVAGVNV